jgi:CubicO group peptidase (beta-lactamase class C family)
MEYRSFALIVLGMIAGQSCVAASTIDQQVDAFVRTEMMQRHIPGMSIAVIQNRQVKKLSSYGTASIDLSVPVQPATVFHVASISKSFTAVAVMMLVEAGKVSLDDRIGKYLDSIPPNWRDMPIRRLMNHTSGIPDIMIDSNVSLATIADTVPGAFDLLRERPMDFEPGTRWRYNQTGYLLLSMLIEKLSGQSFAQFCASHLFAPLGLKSAVFADESIVVPGRATEYTIFDPSSKSDQPLERPQVLDYRMTPMVYPAGGLNISIADFSRWLLALMDGKILRKESLEAMFAPGHLKDGSLVDGLEYPPPWRSYGLGMMLNPQGAHPQAGHMGGARTSFAIFPKDDLGVVVLTNLQGSDPDSLLTGIASRYLRN